MEYKFSEKDKKIFIQAIYSILHLDSWSENDNKVFTTLKNEMGLEEFNPVHINSEDELIKTIKDIEDKNLIEHMYAILKEAGEQKTNKKMYYRKLNNIFRKLANETGINLNIVNEDDISSSEKPGFKSLLKILPLVLIGVILLIFGIRWVSFYMFLTGEYIILGSILYYIMKMLQRYANRLGKLGILFAVLTIFILLILAIIFGQIIIGEYLYG